MIEELNHFFQALVERYGKGDFVMEVTITDEAAKLISHVGPGVGESIDIYCAMGRVRVNNGGEKKFIPAPPLMLAPNGDHQTALLDEDNSLPGIPSVRETMNFAPQTRAGYGYRIFTILDGWSHGEVDLPNGEVHKATWDAHGNEVSGRPKFSIAATAAI